MKNVLIATEATMTHVEIIVRFRTTDPANNTVHLPQKLLRTTPAVVIEGHGDRMSSTIVSLNEIPFIGYRHLHVPGEDVTTFTYRSSNSEFTPLTFPWNPVRIKNTALMIGRRIDSNPHQSRHGHLDTNEFAVLPISVHGPIDEHSVCSCDPASTFCIQLRNKSVIMSELAEKFAAFKGKRFNVEFAISRTVRNTHAAAKIEKLKRNTKLSPNLTSKFKK